MCFFSVLPFPDLIFTHLRRGDLHVDNDGGEGGLPQLWGVVDGVRVQDHQLERPGQLENPLNLTLDLSWKENTINTFSAGTFSGRAKLLCSFWSHLTLCKTNISIYLKITWLFREENIFLQSCIHKYSQSCSFVIIHIFKTIARQTEKKATTIVMERFCIYSYKNILNLRTDNSWKNTDAYYFKSTNYCYITQPSLLQMTVSVHKLSAKYHSTAHSQSERSRGQDSRLPVTTNSQVNQQQITFQANPPFSFLAKIW